MQITTSRGKTFDVRFISTLIRIRKKLTIEIEDVRPLAEIAADFDGLETIEKTETERDGVKTIYEGFTHLVSVTRNAEHEDHVRLTLEMGD